MGLSPLNGASGDACRGIGVRLGMVFRFGNATTIATTLFALAHAPVCGAQSVDAGVVALAADHTLLSDGLFGFGARYSYPVGGRVSVHAGVEHTTGTAYRPGILCAGLVLPGTCTSEEPVRDDARLTMAVGGVDVRVLGTASRGLVLSGDVRLGRVRAESRGATTGAFLSDESALLGGELGAEASWTLTPSSPFALVAGASAGELRPVLKAQVVDGYNPFWTDFNVARLRAGGRWLLGRSD